MAEAPETTGLQAGLYVVATPIGNVEDASPRARRVLAGADMVLAEDTRRTGLLFQRLGLAAPKFLSLHEHNEDGRVPQVLAMLQQGQAVALVSDAGTPLVSDPGYRLVKAVRQAGVRVVPVPGPSAPLTALAACGLPPSPFAFLGFVPRKAGELRRLLEPYAGLPLTLVFFERKDRVARTLELAAEALQAGGDREVCVARELTKDYEEFILGSLFQRQWLPDELRGEVTVVIGPPAPGAAEPLDREAFLQLLAEEAEAGGKPREIARRTAARAPGWSAGDAYDALKELRRKPSAMPDGKPGGKPGEKPNE